MGKRPAASGRRADNDSPLFRGVSVHGWYNRAFASVCAANFLNYCRRFVWPAFGLCNAPGHSAANREPCVFARRINRSYCHERPKLIINAPNRGKEIYNRGLFKNWSFENKPIFEKHCRTHLCAAQSVTRLQHTWRDQLIFKHDKI